MCIFMLLPERRATRSDGDARPGDRIPARLTVVFAVNARFLARTGARFLS